MADELEKNPGNPIPTEGFPVVYTNLASLAANYNDLRIYFADAQPKTVVTLAAPPQTTNPGEATITPRICLFLTPEIAKSLRDALSTTLSAYEAQFGAVRPAP